MCDRLKAAMMQSRKDAVAQQIHKYLKDQSPVGERNYSATFTNSSFVSLKYGESFRRCLSRSHFSPCFYFKNHKMFKTFLAVEERFLMGAKGFKKHWANKENSEHTFFMYSLILKTISNNKLGEI